MTIFWIITGLIAWLVVAILVGVGIGIGRIFRDRDHHYPSPNHPTVRAHKQLTDGRPLNSDETAILAQLEEKLR